MPDPTFRVQVTLPRDSGLARDSVVNVMHFQGDPSGGIGSSDREIWDSMVDELATRVRTFYETLSGFLATTLADVGEINVYDMRDPQPRIPRFTEPIDLSTHGTGSLPAEVALCLSYRAEAVPGANARRRRGRIYIGPFGETATEGPIVAADARPAPTMVAGFLAAAEIMAHGGAGEARLAIYSPTTDLVGTLEDSFNDAKVLWIDNAWDTQRRRGAAATLRSEVTLSS
jgi:hypothetical protein